MRAEKELHETEGKADMQLRLRILGKAEAKSLHEPYNLGLAVFVTTNGKDPYHENVVLESWNTNTRTWVPIPIGYTEDWKGDKFLGQS